MRIPGGDFLMRSDQRLAQGIERHAHNVRVSSFWMDTTHVTNAQFARFVKATGYVAERKPDWETLKVQLPPDSALVPGANRRRPQARDAAREVEVSRAELAS